MGYGSKYDSLDYAGLDDYATSDRQIRVLESMQKHNNVQAVADETGISYNNVSIDLKKILTRASREGNAPKKLGGQYVVPEGYSVKGESVLLDEDDRVKQKWIKTDKSQEEQLESLKEAITDITKELYGKSKSVPAPIIDNEDLVTVYISNDLHFGALSWGEETGDRDYNLDIAQEQVRQAGEYLTSSAPKSKVGIVADLGDLTEMDDYKNATPHSGNVLDVDGRYSKVFKVALYSLIRLVEKALEVHEEVRFINIAGNHDITTALAVRLAVEAYFCHEPRVIVDNSPKHVKYHKHGKQLIGFAHGDGLKMRDAGETMALDCHEFFSDTKYRDMHFGHTHKDAVYDGKLCRSESHRNIAPLNSWASHKGYRRGLGTMKAISYHKNYGEIGRNMFNVGMMDND